MSTPTFSPYTQSAEQLAVLMNATFLPPTIFSDATIQFELPQTVAGDGYDTTVQCDGIPGRGYYGPATIMYTRVNLSVLAGLVNLFSTTPFTQDMVLSMMNAELGTFLEDDDIETMTIPSVSAGNSETVTMTAASTSLGWTGSVDIVLNYGKPSLASVIGSTELSTMKVGPLIAGRDMLFNFDFTSWRDSLAVTLTDAGQWYAYNDYASYTTFLNLCNSIGIPWFPEPNWQNSLSDQPTSAVPDSNQNFDRVVIQQQAQTSSALEGPLYFHYNTTHFDGT